MSKSSFPPRIVWPKLLPTITDWQGWGGVVLGVITFFLPSVVDWWIKVSLILLSFTAPTLVSVFWKIISVIWKRLKQYDLLYDKLMLTDANNQQLQDEFAQSHQQLQENFGVFLQILMSFAGIKMFEVTSIVWGNKSPLLAIASKKPVPIGSKLVIINIDTLDVLGRFEIVQTTIGGYLVQENLIVNAVWWGFLHNELVKYAHPRITNAVAILLHR